jgi:DNA-binding MarR family transcriptional regulator
MFKPSKLRTESPGASGPENAAPVQTRAYLAGNDSFREALVSLLTEAIATVNRLKTGAGADLPAGAGSILQILEHHGARTVPQIARTRFTSRQNIQILVNRLAREGLIQFTDNPAHKRSDLVILTAKGEEVLAGVGKRRQQLLDHLAAQFSEQELLSGTTLLRNLRQALAERPPTPDNASSEAPRRRRAADQGIDSDESDLKKDDAERKDSEAQNLPDSELPFNLL